VTRRHRRRSDAATPTAFGYVRDADTPVHFSDVVSALRALAEVASRSRDREMADAARRVEALVESLRSQFIDDLVGARLPSETGVAVDRSRTRHVDAASGGQDAEEDDAVTRLRPSSSRAASNS